MAWVKKTITITEERRTYLLGEFTGKFYGLLDKEKGETPFECFYNLRIYEAEVVVLDKAGIRPAPQGPFTGFTQDDTFPGKLPDPLPCDIRLAPFEEQYKLELREPKFKKGSIEIIDHQYEGDEVFGTLKAVVSGYLIDYVTREEEREVWEDENTRPGGAEKVQTIPSGPLPGESPQSSQINKSYRKRPQAISKPVYESNGAGCLPSLLTIIGTLALIVWLLVIGIKGIITLLILAALVFSFYILGTRFFRWILVLYLLFMAGAFFYSIVKESSRAATSRSNLRTARNEARERTEVRRASSERRTNYIDSRKDDYLDIDTTQTKIEPFTSDPNQFDTLISHHRIWKDYSENQYEGDLQIPISSFRQSTFNRMLFNIGAGLQTNMYDALLHNLYSYDSFMLNRVYYFFDSIGVANNLDRMKFAEMIVSCVQDIPYTLILNEGCNPYLYNDNFIRQYLSTGKDCEGNVKFGLYAPAEFVGSLKGDCDTRTLLLYSILSHYGYEVAILSSEVYKHSILAINLPYAGVYKLHDGKRLYVWETTYPDFKPGIIPSDISNMDFWRISLINKKNKL